MLENVLKKLTKPFLAFDQRIMAAQLQKSAEE